MTEGEARNLQDELTNRRQYLAFLESFQSEVAKSVDQVYSCRDQGLALPAPKPQTRNPAV